MQRAEKIIEIDAPLERVFDLFSDFESFPRWMRNIREVRYSGRRMSRWKAHAPLGTSVEWEAETIVFEPDHRIVWHSVRGDVDTEGEVVFEETRRGTTMLRVVLGYDPPAGRLGAMVAGLFGINPQQQLDEDLERFALVAEGRRESRSRRSDARPDEREHVAQRTREAGPADERREYVRSQVERRRRDHDIDERFPARRERDSRAEFEEALREARRSQMESIRRYREDREREEHARVRDDERRRGFKRAPEEDKDERRRLEPQSGHAMTPRERERERSRRRTDDEYSGQAFRRGVDRLMDEPPSRHWRRWEREE
jgi:uncharacterized protein YndB with AHSA1/START domain